MKKHSCQNCSSVVHIDNAAVVFNKYQIVGRHIHTGRIQTIAGYDTEQAARQRIAYYEKHCSSHDDFCLFIKD